MAKVKLELGATLDLASPDDMTRIMREAQIDAEERELARVAGIQSKRFRLVGVADGSGNLLLGQNEQIGPRAGYLWQIRRLVFWGATTGDEIGIYFGAEVVDATQFEWSLGDGAGTRPQPQYTFSKGQLTMHPGETLLVANITTLTAGAPHALRGEVMEVPAVMQGKLA